MKKSIWAKRQMIKDKDKKEKKQEKFDKTDIA
jgi:hypothetical protein